MPETKTAEMIFLPANYDRPVRRLGTREAALRMLRELAAGKDDETV